MALVQHMKLRAFFDFCVSSVNSNWSHFLRVANSQQYRYNEQNVLHFACYFLLCSIIILSIFAFVMFINKCYVFCFFFHFFSMNFTQFVISPMFWLWNFFATVCQFAMSNGDRLLKCMQNLQVWNDNLWSELIK